MTRASPARRDKQRQFPNRATAYKQGYAAGYKEGATKILNVIGAPGGMLLADGSAVRAIMFRGRVAVEGDI